MTLLIVHFFGCQFAVKSGGHAAFKGASNIDSGITIDLKNLKQIAVSADRSSTKVGAGNHWADVYSRLEPLGLSVVGGRVANIGVGGLTLGGKCEHLYQAWHELAPCSQPLVSVLQASQLRVDGIFELE